MDRETVLRLAKAAGMCGMATTVVCEVSELERFASAVAAAVKEEDARICDARAVASINKQSGDFGELSNVLLRHHGISAGACAIDIRASIKGVK